MEHDAEAKIAAGWDEVFKKSAWGRYPSEEIIRFVQRKFGKLPNRESLRFLDLGCGIGTTCWYLAREGFFPDGMDGSETALNTAKEWFAHEGLKADFKLGLFQALPYANNTFDAVIDNCSVTGMPRQAVESISKEIERVLKPGGWYYGSYFGKKCTISGTTDPEDPFFYRDINDGALQNSAGERLFDEQELQEIYQNFDHITLDYLLRTLNNRQWQVENWIITCQKRS